jgi:hypothetical protein
MGRGGPGLHQMGSFEISNFKSLGYAIRQFNLTATMIIALDCYNPTPISTYPIFCVFFWQNWKVNTREGKQPKYVKMKPFVILFFLDPVAAVSTTVVSFAWHLDICTLNSQK